MTKRKIKEMHHRWKGGSYKSKSGYIMVRVYPDDFFSSMRPMRGYVREHRLVMAKHLGRCLLPSEDVHHKNGIKDDNRLENLELTMRGVHITTHNKGYRDGFLKGYYDGKDKQIKELKTEVQRLNGLLKVKEVNDGS